MTTSDDKEYKKYQMEYLELLKKKKVAESNMMSLTHVLSNHSNGNDRKPNEIPKILMQIKVLEELYDRLVKDNEECKAKRKAIIVEEQKKTEILCTHFNNTIDNLQNEIKNSQDLRLERIKENTSVRDEFRSHIGRWEQVEKERVKNVELKEKEASVLEQEGKKEIEQQRLVNEHSYMVIKELELLEMEQKRLTSELEECQSNIPNLNNQLSGHNDAYQVLKAEIEKLSKIRHDNASTIHQLLQDIKFLKSGRAMIETDLGALEQE
eukprot:Ihof_evm1s1110 gene=Ihof_evmTU1s1110